MKDLFIGRTIEIQHILQKISTGTEKFLISLYGPGGVGKTTLAGEIMARIKQDYPDMMIIHLDLDFRENRSALAVQQLIARSYNGDLYIKFSRQINLLKTIENSPDSEASKQFNLVNAQENINDAFKELVKAGSAKRVFILVDTLDRVSISLCSEILLVLSQLDNVVMLVCGRQNAEIGVKTKLEQTFGKNWFEEIELKPFGIKETKIYLNRLMGLKQGADPDFFRKLWLLAEEGRPIYLDLAATWILDYVNKEGLLNQSQGWPGQELVNLPLRRIEENLKYYRREFARQLVSGVLELKNSLDWAVLYMAFLERPFTTDLWVRILGISFHDAEKLEKDLHSLFFVRANNTLHDEMKALVKEFAWPAMGIDNSSRKWAISKLLDYLEKAEPNPSASDHVSWAAEILGLKLDQDRDNGFSFFLQKFDSDLENGIITECKALVEALQGSQHYEQLTREQQKSAQLRISQLAPYSPSGKDTTDSLDNVLKKSYSSIEEHIKAISSYAFNLRDTNPRQSVDIYIRALELAQQDKNDVWVAKVSNWLGTAYRRLSEYDIAIEYLQKAIDIRKQYKLDGDVAASKNNLAYVYRLKGDIDKAIHLARSAFATRQKMNDQQGIAYSLLTIAEIYRDRNDENGAWERFTQARKIFQGLGNELEVANVDIKLANIYRKRHEPILAKEFIDEAIEIFRQLKNVEGLADALNESACEQRKKARELSRTFRKPEEAELAFRTAEKEFQESIDICYKTGNQYRLADNLSDLALLYRYWYEHDIEFGSESNRKFDFIVQAKRASYKAITISRRANLVLPESRALEALGDLYYAHKLYFKAFAQYYLPAGIILAEYYEKGSSRYQILFDRIHRKILNPNIRNTELKLCASYLARRWKEEGKATIAKGFVDLYQGIADEIEDGD